MTSEDLVVAVFDALAALQVPFMVSGSLASNFYGVPRATQDADLVLELSAVPVDAFAARLQDVFDLDAARLRDSDGQPPPCRSRAGVRL